MQDVKVIEKELMTLIQDEGLTPQRLALHGESVLNVIACADPRLAVNILTKACETVEGNYGTALRNALGVDYEEETNLSQRRAFLIEGDNFPDISEATLRRWERKGITLMARTLLNYGFSDQQAEFAKAYGSLKREDAEKVQLMRLALVDVRNQLAEQTALLREIRDALRERGQGAPSDGSQSL